MKKTALLIIALMASSFFATTAQKNLTMQERLQQLNTSFESPDLETPKFPMLKKSIQGQDWWGPDTAYSFTNNLDGTWSVCLIVFSYQYDSQGLIAVNSDHLEYNNLWLPFRTLTRTYDSNYNLLNETWKNGYSNYYTYDSNNNKLTELGQVWLGNYWASIELYTYTYDSNNNMLTKKYHLSKNNTWIHTRTITYSYDSNNNRISEHFYNANNDSWVNTGITTYTYSSDNDLIIGTLQNLENDSLINFHRTIYSNDSDINTQTITTQLWENDSWVNNTQKTYTCDSNQNLVYELHQKWDYTSWRNYKQFLMEYDENNNCIKAECWNWIDDSWQLWGNKFNNRESVWIYYNNMQSVFGALSSDYMTATYIKVSDIKTNVESILLPGLNKISIYPNPTKGELQIENGELKITNIQIFDIIGNKVLSPIPSPHWRGVSEGRGEVDISHLPAGIYFVQITTEKGIETKKVVKR